PPIVYIFTPCIAGNDRSRPQQTQMGAAVAEHIWISWSLSGVDPGKFLARLGGQAREGLGMPGKSCHAEFVGPSEPLRPGAQKFRQRPYRRRRTWRSEEHTSELQSR